MSRYYKDLLKKDAVSDEDFKRAKDFIITVLQIEDYDLSPVQEISGRYFIDKEIQDAVIASQNSGINFLNKDNFVKFLDKSESYLQDTKNAQIKEQLKGSRSKFWRRFCESINKKNSLNDGTLVRQINKILPEKFGEIFNQKPPSITDVSFNYLLFIYFLLNLTEFNDSSYKESLRIQLLHLSPDKNEAFMQAIKSSRIKSIFLIPRLILKKHNIELDQSSRIFFQKKPDRVFTENPVTYSLHESFTLDMLEDFKLVFGDDWKFLNDLKDLDSEIFTKLQKELSEKKNKSKSESDLKEWLSIQEKKDKDSTL